MFVPAFADAGPVLTTVRSALVTIVAFVVEVLLFRFGSELFPLMVAVFVRVPVKLGSIFAVSVNDALAPEAKLEFVQLTGPLVPTGGVLQTALGPVFCTKEENVVPEGSGSLSIATGSVSGPPLETVIV
jgi:hypothetical protein